MGIYDFNSPDNAAVQLYRLQGNTPYLRRGSRITQTGSYSPLDSAVIINGTVDPAAGGLAQIGSNGISVQSVGFAFVSQNPFVDKVTLYWDGTNGSSVIVIRRGDRTARAVPGDNVAISGLTASTRYYMLPFWSKQNPCSIGWVAGTVGTPQLCFTVSSDVSALAQQSYVDRDPLSNGFMYFDTPAAGGSGGGGAGGGGGKPCVMHSTTEIEPLEGAEFTTTLAPESEWIHIEVAKGRTLNCTYDHPLYTALGERVEAQAVKVGDWLTMKYGDDVVTKAEKMTRRCTKAQVNMRRIHLFWANEFLCHNIKYSTA